MALRELARQRTRRSAWRSATSWATEARSCTSAWPCAITADLKRLHLADHLRVDRGEAVRIVDPGEQVGDARRAEDHVERRRGRGRVEREQPFHDQMLAAGEVRLRDDELAAVHLLLVLDLGQLEVREVDALVGRAEALVELEDLVVDLLRLGLLRVDRRGAEGRGGTQRQPHGERGEKRQQHQAPPPLNDGPRYGTRPARLRAPARHEQRTVASGPERHNLQGWKSPCKSPE